MKLYEKRIPEQEIRFDGKNNTLQNFMLGMLGAGMASSLLLTGGRAMVTNDFSSIIGEEIQYSADELMVYSVEGYDKETKEEKQRVQIFQVINEDNGKEIAKEEVQTSISGNMAVLIGPEQFEQYGNSISSVREQYSDAIIIVKAPINSLLEFYGVDEKKNNYSESDLLELKSQLEASKKSNKEVQVEEQSVKKEDLKDDINSLYQMRELLIGKTVIEYPEMNSQKVFVKK